MSVLWGFLPARARFELWGGVVTTMNSNPDPYDESTLRRVCSEFMEMPGLRLTSRQAQRLWGLDSQVCEHLLAHLVEAGFLARREDDVYVRVTDGSADFPRSRMTRTTIDGKGHVGLVA